MKATEVMATLGARLKAIRERRGLTQQELSNAAEVALSVITKLERDAQNDPRMSSVVAIAQALEVSLDELVLGVVKGPAQPAEGGPAAPPARQDAGRKPRQDGAR